MPGLAEVGDSKGERNLLLQNSVKNARVSQIYRSDYECFWLRKSRRMVKRLSTCLKKPQVSLAELIEASKCLMGWCERERILLRIPLPAAMKLDEKKARARGVNYLDITPSAPDVIHEANVPGEPGAQPKRGPGRPPKQRPIEPAPPTPSPPTP